MFLGHLVQPVQERIEQLRELYDDWVDETDVRVVAVSIDDQRSVNRVAPYVNRCLGSTTSFWIPTETLRANVQTSRTPLSWRRVERSFGHNNYADGDEYELYEGS